MKKKLLYSECKTVLTVFALLLSVLSWGQNSNPKILSQASGNSSHELKTTEQNPLEMMKGKREDISKRDAFSKHYKNEDGSYTAIIGVVPIHYRKNEGSAYVDIDTEIKKNSSQTFPYANTTNLFESYYGAKVSDGIKSKTSEGEIHEFLKPQLYWEVNGQAVNIQNYADVPVAVKGEKAYYNNLFGNISAEFITEIGKRKLNYIIPTKKDLGTIPVGADYLVFSEDIILPSGWSYAATEQGISIKDNENKQVYLYENPVSSDAGSMPLLRDANTVFETSAEGNTLTIRTKVKTSWLLDSNRQFPVKVDPTVNATASASVSVYSDGDVETTGYFGRVANFWLQYHIKFNTSSIPSGSTLSAVTGYIYQYGTAGTRNAASTWAWVNSADPTTTSGTALYNSATALQSTSVATQTTNGWKNSVFTATGRTYVKNGIDNLGYVAAAVYPGGTWNNNNYLGNRTHADTEKPYLAITYTEPAGPPSCATLIGPANGATGVAHQGVLSWNAVGGATSYDVYFGTEANPPLVSTSQTGTTYNPGGCLLPNTQYYWRVVPKNANGSATGCTIWSFTTDGKLNIYKNDWEIEDVGVFNVSGGIDTDGWLTNTNTATGGLWSSGYNNTWTVGNGTNAISGKSVGISALYNGGLAGNFFQYWSDLGEIHRWIYRPFDMRGLRDIEVTFRWKAGGEANQDYGSVISSINGGGNWLMDDQGGLNNDGRYWNSPSTIRTQTITFPDTRNNQQNFVLGFKWDDWSGNGYSLDPSFVVDDIVIKACPYEGNIISNVVGQGVYEWTPTASTQAILTINGSHPCAQFQWEQSTDGGFTWINATGGSGATTVSYTTPSDITITTLYRCKVYFGTGCTGVYQDYSFEIIIPQADCASETKWTSTGWTNGVPDGTGAKKKIVFETDYNSSVNPSNNGALVGCSAEVKNTANVTLESYHSLTIDNEIKIASGASFVLKSDASLLQINNEPDNDNEGVIKVERQITESSSARKEYNYLSSPVIGQNMKKLFGNNVSNTPFALVLDEPSNLFVNAKDSDYQIKAKGFAVKEPKPAYSGTLAEYSGEPVNGEFDIQITKSANNRGWNLVGNPYPSGLDLHSLYYSLENDDVINPEFRFWDNRVNNTYTQYGGNYNGYSYAIYNATTGANGTGNPAPGGDAGDNTNGTPGPATPIAGGFRFVKVGQGFLVRAKNLGTAELNFSNDFRTITQTTDDGFFGKSAQAQDDRYRLQLITPDEMVLTNTVVYFESGNNTFGTEDSKHPSPSASDAFYSFAEEEKVVINGRSSFTDTDIIRLGANHYTSGIYKIRVVDAAGIFPYSQRIYLKDKENNTITDLSGGEYVFSSESGSFTNRFEIVYQPEATLGIAGNTSNIVIYRDGEDFVIRSAKQIRAVELYDISGKLMLVLKKSGKEIRVNAGRMAEGIYILKVEREDGANTMKKIRK